MTSARLLALSALPAALAISDAPPQCGGLKCTPITSPLAIERGDFTLGTFELMPGKTFQDNWGFPDPDLMLPVDHRGYAFVQDKCGTMDQFETPIPLKDYGPLSTVNYYQDTDDFINFQGIDMVPENKKSYIRGDKHDKYMDFERKVEIMKERGGADEHISMHKCRIDTSDKDPDGGMWHVQRVGPFYSTGNYDWWQIGWQDAGFMSEALAKYPHGIDVDRSVMAPTDENGNLIGHPPIHIHHIHTVEAGGVRPRNRLQAKCFPGFDVGGSKLLEQGNCYNSSLFFEQHGDYQCREEDDGLGCFMVGDHQTRRIDQIIDLEGDLNDVRPPNSPVMKWYYQFALHWKPADVTNSITSMMTIMAPGNLLKDNQLTRVATFPTPTDKPTFIWYMGHMWASGELQRNKLHAHNMVFESSQFFAATPEDLGLNNPKFYPGAGKGRAYDTHYTDELGYENNEALMTYMFKNLGESQAKWESKCGGKQHKEHEHEACTRPKPRMICTAVYDGEVFPFRGREFSFDRRPKTYCEPWSFREGDTFLVTGFSRKLLVPPKPDKPDYIPPWIPGHVTWGFWYKHEGRSKSFFGRVVCNQEGIFFDAAETLGITKMWSMVISTMITKGIPSTAYYMDAAYYGGVALLCLLASVVVLIFVLAKRKKA